MNKKYYKSLNKKMPSNAFGCENVTLEESKYIKNVL